MTNPTDRPQTFGQLRSSGYQVLPVKAEIRKNLINRLMSGQTLFPGITGYDETVIPPQTNALLGNQDIILLGERGQAKSRIVRSLANLLDEWTPTIAGTEIPENPFQPITPLGKQIMAEQGDKAPIRWIPRDERYAEKLATPDITIADLIGEVDPIKIAEGRYLSDEFTLHYGLVPRVNRGIFAINELPDLAERIQVASISDSEVAPNNFAYTVEAEQNRRSLRALAARLGPRRDEVRHLAFGHQGPVRGLGPLEAWAAKDAKEASR